MKVTAYMGESGLREVRLSEQERRTLSRAAEILQALRELLEDGRQDYDEGDVVDIALAAHTCRNVVEQSALPIY